MELGTTIEKRPRRYAPRGLPVPGLRAARKARGLSQLALSLDAGVHQVTIHALENGHNTARRSTLAKLARALQVDPVVLTEQRVGSVAAE